MENGAFWCILCAIFDVNLFLMIRLVYIKISHATCEYELAILHGSMVREKESVKYVY